MATGGGGTLAADGAWHVDPSDAFDVTYDALDGETPRLWRSGGPGAWYITESGSGVATARILNAAGFGEGRGAYPLASFAELRAVEATRRGLYCVTATGLVAVMAPRAPPWHWPVLPFATEQRDRTCGLAPAPSGQLYRLTRSGKRLQLRLGSGMGQWRELASASAIGGRAGWLQLIVDAAGDAIFWGCGLVGTFDAGRRRMFTKAIAEIADLPEPLGERMTVLPPGGTGDWSRGSPILVRLADGDLGFVVWDDARASCARLPNNLPELLTAVPFGGAVLARTEKEIVRIAPGEGGLPVVGRIGSAATSEAAAIAVGGVAAFVISNDQAAEAEFVTRESRILAVRERLKLRRDAHQPSGPGFEPVVICAYTPQAGSLRSIWVPLNHRAGHRNGALQCIQRVRIVES